MVALLRRAVRRRRRRPTVLGRRGTGRGTQVREKGGDDGVWLGGVFSRRLHTGIRGKRLPQRTTEAAGLQAAYCSLHGIVRSSALSPVWSQGLHGSFSLLLCEKQERWSNSFCTMQRAQCVFAIRFGFAPHTWRLESGVPGDDIVDSVRFEMEIGFDSAGCA